MTSRLANYRADALALRERGRDLFRARATAAQVASVLSEATDALVLKLWDDALARLDLPARSFVASRSALLAVGGSGRGELAPCSDTDLLFLYEPAACELFSDCAGQMVRDCWDAGLKPGHSLRTITDCINMGLEDPTVATAFIEARLLWGSSRLFEEFRRRFARRVVRRRRRAFIQDVVAARTEECLEQGGTVNRLEPDVKKSAGGLRDVHLIRWVGFAYYGTTDLDLLRRHGALSPEDFRALLAAQEFLMHVRMDLHFHSGRAQDVLTREEQLRIAAERGIEGTAGQQPVERFMQNYFHHSGAIASISHRFVALHRQPNLLSRLAQFATTHRADDMYLVGPTTIDVARASRARALGSLQQILKLYHLAALYGVIPSAELSELLKQAVPAEPEELAAAEAELFFKILNTNGPLAPLLRSMYDVGLLEWLVPDMRHARGLLQFNQYHRYTVDEHTLRALEAAEALGRSQTPVGEAYRSVREKGILRLALLLHDLGKGFDGDHSDVGREIAQRMAQRLHLSERQRDVLVFLVHRHLRMAHLAFRRDTADRQLLIQFTHDVGSPETLRMLYVLTAADLTAVGPGVWTDWKAELLTDLYDQALLMLSGKHLQFQEKQRLERIKEQVREALARSPDLHPTATAEGVQRQLDAFPPPYLIATAPERIARDLALIARLSREDVVIDARFDPETGTIDYRFVTRDSLASGCFHKLAGVLTAHRLEILSAHISTSADGVIVDSFRVLDRDYSGEVPASRIEQVASAVRRVLRGEQSVAQLFLRHKRYAGSRGRAPHSNLPMRVSLDNHSSDRCTIIDVFAHDRLGLLYTIARAIYDLRLSVSRAMIATHLDQVVDVFYVTELDGRKVREEQRLSEIRAQLTAAVEQFENGGYLEFAS